MEAIIVVVPPEMQMPLFDKGLAKEAWDSIATARVSVNRVRCATLQRLRCEWEMLAFRPGEQVGDFTLRLMALKQQLLLDGDTDINEECAVERLLRAAPPKYAQLRIAIETLLDFQDLTIEEVSGRLKMVDDMDALAAEPAVGGLLLTRDQWRAKEDEKVDVVCSKASASLDINEPCARAFLNTNVGEDTLDGWYLDREATHHTTGRRELFAELDTTAHDTLRFDDLSRVEIKGTGSIVFQAKNEE